MATPSTPTMQGMHSYWVCGTRFDVPDQYELLKPMGQGAYGVVCSAIDKVHNRKVAIKKISQAFNSLTDAVRTLREIKLLRHFHHENIISILDMLKPQSYEAFEDVYVVNELMDTDMHQIISSPQPLSPDHCQYFVYQLLRALKYIHSAHVLHRDLKPSNLLLTGDCDLKVCDFGLARVLDPQCGHDAFMTQYVTTRWYRAPEIILSGGEYTQAIDIWAAGCIFGELLARRPIFPGRDYIHQIQLITNLLGSPSDDDISAIRGGQARIYLKSLPIKRPANFSAWFGTQTDSKALDLLQQMLTFNPSKRITCERALAHPYFEELHDPRDEPTCPKPFDFEWENGPLSKELVKRMVFNEIALIHPELCLSLPRHLVLQPPSVQASEWGEEQPQATGPRPLADCGMNGDLLGFADTGQQPMSTRKSFYAQDSQEGVANGQERRRPTANDAESEAAASRSQPRYDSAPMGRLLEERLAGPGTSDAAEQRRTFLSQEMPRDGEDLSLASSISSLGVGRLNGDPSSLSQPTNDLCAQQPCLVSAPCVRGQPLVPYSWANQALSQENCTWANGAQPLVRPGKLTMSRATHSGQGHVAVEDWAKGNTISNGLAQDTNSAAISGAMNNTFTQEELRDLEMLLL